MKRLQVILVFGFLLVTVAMMSANGSNQASNTPSAAAGTAAQASPTAASLGFPLKNPITVTFWVTLTPSEAAVMKSYADKTVWKDMEKITNIHIEFQHPSVAAGEAFNLMLASGDLTDIVQYNNGWKNVQGGLDGLISDKVIMDLTNQVNSNMPNLRKLLNDNPVNVDALMKTGNGRYWGFPAIIIGEGCWAGPIIRKDLLDKFNLQIPVTMDDWENVLKTFKANGIVSPLGFQNDATFNTYGIFIGAYDVVRDYFIGTDNKIHYGPIEDGYKQWLTTFNRWYSEGLIDPEFASIDANTYKQKAITGVYGAYTGSSSEQFGNFNTEITNRIPGASTIAVPYPKVNAGQTLRFRQQSEDVRPGQWTAISAQTKYLNEICKMYDYGYSPEGSFLITYGNEGEAYTLNAQGKPVPTPLLTNNPLGDFSALAFLYCGRNGAYLRDPYEVNFLDYKGLETPARAVWNTSGNASGLRPSYSLPAADTRRVNSIMADVTTYVNEMMLKFIMGQEPLSNWDAYVQNIKKMGIDEAIALNNTAYAAFLSN
ncbi:MAG: extracellular solute-binding protein [Treponema sp.]|nr:extracellular solute-binding protein [Treponema sp.]